jgi:hypothetical protein
MTGKYFRLKVKHIMPLSKPIAIKINKSLLLTMYSGKLLTHAYDITVDIDAIKA